MIDEQDAYERAERTWVKAKPERRKCSNEDCGHTLSQSNKETICRPCQAKAVQARVRRIQATSWPSGRGHSVPAGCGRADRRRPAVKKTGEGAWIH